MSLPRDDAEAGILRALDECVRGARSSAGLESIVSRVAARLARDPRAVLAWEPVPLALFDTAPPEPVASAWVFILRAGATTGAERHPNSHQRMMSYRGEGDLQVWRDGRWRSSMLTDRPSEPLENRWVSVPPHTWHQAVVPAVDWVVVSFHTVAARLLIEERGDPEAKEAGTRRRTYLA